LVDSPKMMQANAKFRKLQRAEDAKKNLSEHEANEAAIRAKTARLKAARLARDAAEQAAPAATVVPVKKKAAKKKKGASGSLSDWLKDQESSGRNN
jgi:hypothetical protein